MSWLVSHHLLPLAAVVIEPAKVLFLNNAINHGVLDPLGVTQALHHGRSILFTLETNPGPGLGVLIAYYLFGPRKLRATVPAAIIIHTLGGIHEIYFPYVLMKPRLILASIAGGASGILVFEVTGAGLVSTPSPGSIFAYIAETPRSNWWGVYAGVIVAAAVSLVVGSALLGFGKLKEAQPDELEEADVDQPAVEGIATAIAAPRETASAKQATATGATSPRPALGQ